MQIAITTELPERTSTVLAEVTLHWNEDGTLDLVGREGVNGAQRKIQLSAEVIEAIQSEGA